MPVLAAMNNLNNAPVRSVSPTGLSTHVLPPASSQAACQGPKENTRQRTLSLYTAHGPTMIQLSERNH
ncbi:hypothetical protein HDV05_005333 [Chytridiales sp. JEL 0842]|nr:hypothetical protein HDV05_005333 [Chytridiales sp. JEL 0842]